MKQLTQEGLNLIKQCEGCVLHSYKDIVGVWTIGYGHTGNGAWPGRKISQAEADDLLSQDLRVFESGVQKLVSAPLGDNQFSALVSFSFNLGLGSLRQSTLLKLLNEHNYQAAADQFLRWDHAGGHVVAGLHTRREKERALFLA